MNRQQRLDVLYMDIAERVSQESKANRLKVGSIMVKNDQLVIGYNGTPSGWDNTCEDENNKTKPEVLHAESNLAAKVMKSTINSVNSTVYVTHAPCINCAKILYQAGVRRVVYKNRYKSNDGIEFLLACAVEVEMVQCEDGI